MLGMTEIVAPVSGLACRPTHDPFCHAEHDQRLNFAPDGTRFATLYRELQPTAAERLRIGRGTVWSREVEKVFHHADKEREMMVRMIFGAICLLLTQQVLVVNPVAADDLANRVVSTHLKALLTAKVHEAMASPDRYHPEGPVPAPKLPPAELVEVKPAIDAPLEKQAVWIPGYWEWDADTESFVWTTGVWRFPPPQRRWLPGKWVRTSEGYVRTSGQWVPGTMDKVTYVSSPPPYKGRFPLPTALAESESWVPGCWIPAEGGKFVWREGFVSRRIGQWVWVPAHYSWTPEGWLFVDGYWDFPLKARGQAFASLQLIDAKYDASQVRVDEFAPVPADAIHESPSGEFSYMVEKFPEQYTLVSMQTDESQFPDSPIVVQRTLPDPPMAVIRGVVRRGALTPAGIEVHLIGHPAVATTDEQGRFEFTDVPYGVYHVRAAGPVQNYTRRAFNRIAVAEPVVEAELELR